MQTGKAKPGETWMPRLVRIFLVPGIVFLFTMSGLVGALVTEGWKDLLSNMAVASALVVTVVILFVRRRKPVSGSVS